MKREKHDSDYGESSVVDRNKENKIYYSIHSQWTIVDHTEKLK